MPGCSHLPPCPCEETEYGFRILPKAGEGLCCDCCTLGRASCEALRCVRRTAESMELQWMVLTPQQAPALECQLQVGPLWQALPCPSAASPHGPCH